MQQKIMGVSGCFPRAARPDWGAFARSLYVEMAHQGAEVSVVAPYPSVRVAAEVLRGAPNRGDAFVQPRDLDIRRPLWWSWSSRLAPWPMAQRSNFHNFSRAVQNAAKSLPPPDWVSAYFFSAGCAALSAFGETVPVYVEIGEGNFGAYEHFMGRSEIGDWLKRFAGVIAVSKPNLDVVRQYADLGQAAFCLESGVDTSRFRPGDRKQARTVLGLPQEAFIVGFTGWFVEGKGPLRLLTALNMLPNAFGLFLGRGPQVPQGERVLRAGPVSNEMVPLMLAACDMYCLPSLVEGLSCAELEAAACGLPLVVSDRPFNRTFLDDRHALFVDPLSPESIAEAIKLLMTSPAKRQEMAIACRDMAEQHSLAHRVTRLFEIVSKRG